MKITKQTFCAAPWFSILVDNAGHLAPCCKIQFNQKHKFKQADQYFHSPELNKIRQDLSEGIKNDACSKCWKDEKNGGDSLRLITNRTLALHSKINLREQIENPKISNVNSFDLVLGNLCNLKCVMCSPLSSSQLLAEANLNPSLHKRYKKKYSQKDFEWPNNENFVDWCSQHLPQAVHIKFSGGEPFLIPWISDAIECIPDHQKAKCVLHFTTNLTIINHKIFDIFKNFKQVWLSVSVEGTHGTHEYLRHGHSWKTLSRNIEKISEKKIQNLIFDINHVVQAPSYHSLLDMIRYFDKLNMLIHPILLSEPKFYHISALSKVAKQNFLDATEKYNGFNHDFVKFVRSVSKEYIEQNKSLTKECIRDLDNLDKVRGNSHSDVIPKENLAI